MSRFVCSAKCIFDHCPTYFSYKAGTSHKKLVHLLWIVHVHSSYSSG
jgi:hypothetical protein